MLGAIAGDIIGSTYEFNSIKTKEFDLFPKGSSFTDDTVLSMAISKSLLDSEPYLGNIVSFGLKYFDAGYGGFFRKWLKEKEHKPYNTENYGKPKNHPLPSTKAITSSHSSSEIPCSSLNFNTL